METGKKGFGAQEIQIYKAYQPISNQVSYTSTHIGTNPPLRITGLNVPNSTVLWNITESIRRRASRCNSQSGKVTEKASFGAAKSARIAVSIGLASAAQGGLAGRSVGFASAEELVLRLGGCDFDDIFEEASLEDTTALFTALDGVSRDGGPDAVDCVEEGCAGEGGATAGGVVNVVV